MQTLEHTSLTGPFEYPGVMIRYGADVFYFDCGEGQFPQKLAQRTQALFLSHLHLDHTFGLERLINNRLGAAEPLSIFGPAYTIERLWHRIQAHTWNLLPPGGLNLILTDLAEGRQSPARVSIPDNLGQTLSPETGHNDNIAFSGNDFQLRYTVLDHMVPSIAYAFCERDSANIDPELLQKEGLKPGPWIENLKKAFLADKSGSVTYQDKRIPVKKLAHLLTVRPGRKNVYAVDFGYTEVNVRKITALAEGADTFYCEAHFSDKDAEKAAQTFHLTTGQAETIAQSANVKELCLIHRSMRYKNDE